MTQVTNRQNPVKRALRWAASERSDKACKATILVSSAAIAALAYLHYYKPEPERLMPSNFKSGTVFEKEQEPPKTPSKNAPWCRQCTLKLGKFVDVGPGYSAIYRGPSPGRDSDGKPYMNYVVDIYDTSYMGQPIVSLYEIGEKVKSPAPTFTLLAADSRFAIIDPIGIDKVLPLHKSVPVDGGRGYSYEYVGVAGKNTAIIKVYSADDNKHIKTINAVLHEKTTDPDVPPFTLRAMNIAQVVIERSSYEEYQQQKAGDMAVPALIETLKDEKGRENAAEARKGIKDKKE